MQIYVDADACPVVGIVEYLARENNIDCTLLCDTNHVITSDYSKVEVISPGPDAVDFALINRCQKGDIVVTQDYGVAALALSKGAQAIHQSGMLYTNDNIDSLLMSRYQAQRTRRAHSKTHLRGPAVRSEADDLKFYLAFEKLLQEN